MALQRARLADIQTIAAAPAALYANPSGNKSLITGLWLFNGNTTVETVKVYLVPDNASAVGTASATKQIAEIAMQPKESVALDFGPLGLMLTDQNDTLQAETTTASKVTAVVCGDLIT